MKIWPLMIGQIYVASIFTLDSLFSMPQEQPGGTTAIIFNQRTLQQRAARVLIQTHQDHAIIESSKIPKHIKIIITQEQKYLDTIFMALTSWINSVYFAHAETEEGSGGAAARADPQDPEGLAGSRQSRRPERKRRVRSREAPPGFRARADRPDSGPHS